jgi:ketosteroid isomerase-like protein
VASISTEDVRTQVQRFWSAFTNKNGDVLESMYFPAATVFNPIGAKAETARLTLARRLRQFAEEKSSRKVEIGTIDVRVMDDVGIASYSYDFHLSSIGRDGGQFDIDVPFSCATQVFLRDKDGALRIAHEHFSSAEAGKKTQVSRQSTSIPESMMPRSSASGGARGATGSLPVPDTLFAEQIRGEVRKFWQLYRSKNREAIERMYSPTGIMWTVGAKRGVPARLGLAAKAREVLGPQSSVAATLGSMDVQTLSKNVAVASYAFRYRVVVVERYGRRADLDVPIRGQRYVVDCPTARETQVFERDATGALQIVHDHLSPGGVPIYTELPAGDNETAKV